MNSKFSTLLFQISFSFDNTKQIWNQEHQASHNWIVMILFEKSFEINLIYFVSFQNELYCLRCHFKMGIPICGACRRPIEERVVTALGKHWHVEHFVCAKCEKPFLGNRHYERKGKKINIPVWVRINVGH